MKTILIVDDAIFMRIMLKNILSKNNYTVIAEASNGEEAIEQFKKFNPDIVTLDITMPEMDGLTALEKILKINPAAVVCMVSAVTQKKVILEAIKKGAKGFIAKPFDVDDVLDKLNTLTI